MTTGVVPLPAMPSVSNAKRIGGVETAPVSARSRR
jgi:hypothetical protein